jgi:hypothetical protein
MKSSKDPVVEHKGNGGLAPAGVRGFVHSFSSFRWQTQSRVCLPFGSQAFRGGHGAQKQ